MVVIDATMLMHLLRPGVISAAGRSGKPVEMPRERIAHLVSELDKSRVRVAIPTPALSEVLVRAGAKAAREIVEEINRHSVLQIVPFDALAAIELSVMLDAEFPHGRKKLSDELTWAKLKFDRQIVAIAVVLRATAIYSDDGDVRAVAGRAQIPVYGLEDLPVPDGDLQGDLPLYRDEGRERS